MGNAVKALLDDILNAHSVATTHPIDLRNPAIHGRRKLNVSRSSATLVTTVDAPF